MTKDQFQRAASLSADLAARWYPHLVSTMTEFGITTPARQGAFIAQIGTESGGFITLSESFNYSIAGLSVFGNRLTASQREQLGRRNGEGPLSLERQRAIANLAYANRFGNKAAGDGYKFRGRGLKQITFLDNYLACGRALGIDLISDPDLLLQDEYAARSAGWFWKANNCNRFADPGDFTGLTKCINGGINGLPDRQARLLVAQKALGLK
ncbi:glycoside hydrolase family 19 protein [Ewingella americana]|uniref:Phage endolysin n=2 Tax=Ewingella americana TaxID=41202 RepID=A0A085G116_EWIA3|nr:glycoside hydrolase family 19 protein [Ewingella americana]KAA8726734.1 glycoside hydrolase family 19 protein [Ewingella americana]KFC77411.1 phage endolysin [Ewingella americana ATCC 33852]STS10357.1 Predicted chitinase [Ewingella americana]